MKPVTWGDVKNVFKVDDEVWACAFQPTSDKEGKHNFSKPIRGRLVCGNTESSDKYRRDKGYKDVAYFVPYKKNGIDLAWSKAVTIYARYFSKTEQESIDFYNKLVQEHIDWLTKEAESLKSLLI